MKYCDFLQPFYNTSPSKSGLRGETSQAAIAKFFVEVSFAEGMPEEFIYTEDTYRKWLTGTNKPKRVYWEKINEIFDEALFRDKLSEKLNDNVLSELFKAFGIQLESEREPDRQIFIEVLTMQFQAIVIGRGDANDIMNSAYQSKLLPDAFKKYIGKAVREYNRVTLLDGDECLLEDCYVCNYIGTSSGVFVNRRSTSIIKDATLEKIKTYDRRGINKNTILIGSGGIGKTLMLQHLFIEAAQHYCETGILPIFVELREFSYNHNELVDSIVELLQNLEETCSADEIKLFLKLGKCQILLDGVDEIDPYDIKDFQRKLASFMKKYPNNQIVMTSRACDVFSGIKGFVRLHLLPFDEEQSMELIDKLLVDVPDREAKTKIVQYIENGFIKKGGVFVSNPMLLTFVVERYPNLDKFYGNRLLFYKTAYEEIVLRHDNYKTAYERIFRSANDPDEFTKVFKEFCGETYRRGIFEFDTTTFEKYFNELKSIDQLENPKKMKVQNFLHDACATACMMYEYDTDIFYVDPGFQEYFFADYYANADTKKVKELGKSLWTMDTNTFRRWNAFKMLYDFSAEKAEVCLLLPYLESIFRGKTDQEAFISFFSEGYDSLRYSILDEDAINEYKTKASVLNQMNIGTLIEPRSVLLSIILKLLKERNFFKIVTQNTKVAYKEFAKIALTGEYVKYHSNGQSPPEERLLLSGNPQGEFDDMASFEETHAVEKYIRDDAGQIICFGNEYEISTNCINNVKYQDLIQVLRENERVIAVYEHVKSYYFEIKKKQKSNDFQ
ncbi:NACHT domain-containing protein [Blautia producta]|nr:NACHT domain-containing protein [Blautia producta]